MEDHCQDINKTEFINLAGIMEHFLEGIGILTQMRRVTDTNLLFCNNLSKT